MTRFALPLFQSRVLKCGRKGYHSTFTYFLVLIPTSVLAIVCFLVSFKFNYYCILHKFGPTLTSPPILQDTIFEDYTIQSAVANNTINLEVPIAPLHRALRSAQNAISASLRLTKKDNVPLLSLTILTSTPSTTSSRLPGNFTVGNRNSGLDDQPDVFNDDAVDFGNGSSREATITQDVAVRVLSAPLVEGIHEPRCREPDVHILLPSLLQLKSISERFTKLAISAVKKPNSTGLQSGGGGLLGPGPRLELAANMHGELRLGIRTEALKIESKWKGLSNPELDPGQVEGGEEGIRDHPSTRMKQKEGEEGWAVVRVEGRDWGRVLGVGRMGGKVIACTLTAQNTHLAQSILWTCIR